MRSWPFVPSGIFLAIAGLSAVAAAQKGMPQADSCWSKFNIAQKKCADAEAEDTRKAQEECEPGADQSLAALRRSIACLREVGSKLRADAKACRQEAVKARDVCGTQQANVDRQQEQTYVDLSRNEAVVPRQVKGASGRMVLPEFKPAQDKIHLSWHAADRLANETARRFEQTAAQFERQAASLERQVQLQSPSAKDAPASAPAGRAADQGGSGPLQALSSGVQPPGSASNPWSPNVGVAAASSENPFARPSIDGGATAPEFGAGSPTENASSDGGALASLTDASSHEIPSAAELPPLPGPEKTAEPAAATPVANALPPLPEKEAAATDPSAESAPAPVAGRGSTATASSSGGSAAGWFPSFDGFTNMFRDPMASLFGGDAKKNSDVDLRRFLPQGRRGPANARPPGMHGPHADLFGEISRRYYDLGFSLEP